MAKLFMEEQVLLEKELEVWYEAMRQFTAKADGIFSEKGKMYDRESPVWERVVFPGGFLQEIRKKTDRVKQLLVDYDPEDVGTVNWSFEDGVLEELSDIFNFARMFGGLIAMKLRERREHHG